MPRLRVQSLSISLDGYGAGPNQDLEHPLGIGGEEMFDRFLRTRTWTRMHGGEGGETGPDESWKGWWGEEQAMEAANGRDVRLGGGVSTIRQYLRAALIDELHLVISPVVLGTGEHLLQGIDLRALGDECVEHVAGARAAAHVILRKRA
jgi:hypothetical protein